MQKILRLFSGRLSRINFLFGMFLAVLPAVALFVLFWFLRVIETVLGLDITGSPFIAIILPLLGVMVFPWQLLVTISCLIRRHHDLGQSAYYPVTVILVLGGLYSISSFLVQLLSLLYLLYLILFVGIKTDNKYGNINSRLGFKEVLGLT